ncbi:hypothetical protein A6R68_10640 [Neotoma lepida]|uniref:Replication protein A C-terminal domain-containing protein n=1 Tax=Neotoma lepida TaxID=56216 RepID=A0A1A6FXB5_NEOLE|nr:hypothetical protein A6R68_10640 [Neotoma lepida]
MWHQAPEAVLGAIFPESRDGQRASVEKSPREPTLLYVSSHQTLPSPQKMMSKCEFGNIYSLSDDNGASGASGSHEQARVQDLRLPSTLMSRPGIHSIVPCCISQLLNATEVDNVFKIKGFALHRVSVVGMIMKAKKASRYIMYKITDLTAKSIQGRQPLSRGRVRQHVIPLPVGVYAKVLGVLQSWDETRWLGILSIRVLEDMNELSTHTLEVVNAHMMLGQHREGVTPGRQLLAEAPARVAATRVSGGSALNFIHKEVLRLIQECSHQEGKAVTELRRQLLGVTEEAVTQAIKYLITTGHISPTVDRQHLKIDG